MMMRRPLVAIVDDDESVRESLPDLVKEFGYEVAAFPSAEEFLASNAVARTRCLILDIAMPGMSGPDLQKELIRRGHDIPVVFITAQSDAPARLCLLEHKTVSCLFKPFSDDALLEALHAALEPD